MGDAARVLDIVDAAISEGARQGLALVAAEDERLDGRHVTIRGRRAVNFASCSYLGLELDPRLRAGAIDAIERFGTQFSSSRTYLSAPLYEELEALLDEITGGHALVTPNTTLGHLSALPVLIAEEDAVILDHHVHHTVHLAIPQLRAQGTHVEFLRHGELAALEERMRALRAPGRRIWYVADGIYSMYGSTAPLDALRWLLTRYEDLHLYVDDAHGMSWTGLHGRGFALDKLRQRERVYAAVSLNKAFGAGGGALVFPDAESLRRVRTCGGPMIFTGPLQPPMLGAAVASARIHLSPEIETLQAELRERIAFANARARSLDLPLVGRGEVPIRYVGLGLPRVANAMAASLLEDGLLVNSAIFPAVPVKRSGVRFTVTRHQRAEDLARLLDAMAERLPDVLAAEGGSREAIDRSFGFVAKSASAAPTAVAGSGTASGLQLEHANRIDALDAESWDRCLGARGSFSSRDLRLLERTFGTGERPEDQWGFHYYLVRGADGRPLLATFFTEALWKDDVVAKASVSRAVEAQRQDDPYYLTSRVFGMGSLLTEGDHLFLDRAGDWRGALQLLLAAVGQQADACGAQRVVLRDFAAEDAELEAALREAGFTPVPLRDSMVLDVGWGSWDEHVAALGPKSRHFQRKWVAPFEKAFAVEVLQSSGRTPGEEEWAQLYRLYRNVHARSLDLNTFALPAALFRHAFETPGWEIVELRLRPEAGGGNAVRAFALACAQGDAYVPLVAGLDYPTVKSHGAYRQLLRQLVARAAELGARRVLLGMGAELEKRRFGAQHVKRRLYFQSRDHYQQDVLALLAAEPAGAAARR